MCISSKSAGDADAAVQGPLWEKRPPKYISSSAKVPAPLPSLPEGRGKNPHQGTIHPFPKFLGMKWKTFTSSGGRQVEAETDYDCHFASCVLL